MPTTGDSYTADFDNLIIYSNQSITDMVQFHAALRDIEMSDQGILYPAIHTYKEVPLGGGSIFPALQFVNGWTLQFPAGNFEVRGGNLTATINPVEGCYVDRTQSAAYAVTAVGGTGLSQTDIDSIANKVWDSLKNDHSVVGSFAEHVKSLGNSASNTTILLLPSGVTRTIGSDQGGTITNLLSHDDSYFSTGEVVGQGLDVRVTATQIEEYTPQSCNITGYYNGSAGHYVSIQLFNYVLGAYETVGTMLSRTTPFDYSIPVSSDHKSSVDGTISIRFIHSISTYNNAHRLHIDFVQFTFVDTTSTLIADVNAIKNKTDQLEFTFGNINANSKMISDSINAADSVEANIDTIKTTLDQVKSLTIAGL